MKQKDITEKPDPGGKLNGDFWVLGKDEAYNGKEYKLQIACVEYLQYRYPKVLFFHIPNGGKMAAKNGYMLKRMGMLNGVPDLFCSEPRHDFNGLYVELKVKSGKVSDVQKTFLNKAIKRGYFAAVVYSLDAFINLIDRYFETEK